MSTAPQPVATDLSPLVFHEIEARNFRDIQHPDEATPTEYVEQSREAIVAHVMLYRTLFP